MNVLYFGKICDEELFKKKQLQEEPFFIAQYLFEKALCNQFTEDNKVEIDIVSIYQTNYFPEDILFFNRKNKSGIRYLKFLNLPYLRELSYFISTCIQILFWFVKNINKKDKCIYSSCHFPPVSLAIVIMGRLLFLKKVVTFTDLSLFTYSDDKIGKMKLYKRVIIKPYILLVNKLQKSYDGYILFAEEMNHIVNTRNKPYIMIEGMYNNDNLNLVNVVKENAIAHAGTLNKEVGIETILNVFNEIKDDSIELWLIGKGDMNEEIIKRASIDKRIKYLGFMPRKEVFEKLKQARLLLNLRDPEDLYTKYSFPSKMFEFMVSGTPVLTTRIKGIPREYYNYIYAVDSYNIQDIKNKVIEVLNKNDLESEHIGKNAQQFIINNKNKEKQTGKVISFIKGIQEINN